MEHHQECDAVARKGNTTLVRMNRRISCKTNEVVLLLHLTRVRSRYHAVQNYGKSWVLKHFLKDPDLLAQPEWVRTERAEALDNKSQIAN